ncbi:aminotransferase class V-fold PLP-dependent enzyme [Shewanella psychrotolerans]|uniref:aminotransferase class V-fold PLP-dependent enzyme n=1 Tax=Shewanella psychrotolerans TaxID=2864206 RepID=UPI001C65B74C|nr:aminotransferase class V-fold PLP-dependent enzyme [Shewanella psychrotolerans]QYK01649.1 aminotransferase class V-fold PLP-dependent enzyme [Shewanella psychrotolerans]
MLQDHFVLAEGTYLLNHSVGRPLKTSESAFQQAFFVPWQASSREPWGEWLGVIDSFAASLAQLFNSPQQQFCPQVNLSSALTKLVMALPRLVRDDAVVLMSEIDFPSMGFVLQKALPHCQLRFIAKHLDVTDPQVWADHLSDDVDLVFISHAYSNTGQQAPIAEVINLARSRGCLSLIDVAQSAGVLPIDLTALQPDFMIGSSVKWLCGGPGAAYLWLHESHIESCQPQDVGWFSHENPFEFDIHDFRYHPSALKFWGGTPSIAPYAIASHSIAYFAKLGIEVVRQHNQQQIDKVAASLGEQFVSPREYERRSGTMILQFLDREREVMAALSEANISVDARSQGIRVSPHVYNTEQDVARLLRVITPYC